MKKEKETFRVFLGTYLEDHSVLKDYEAIKRLWPEKLRWVATENLHFTWKFLGDITQSRINRVVNDLSHCIKDFKPSNLLFNSIEIWPKLSSARQLVWTAKDLNNNITDNFKLLDKTLKNTGFTPEKRPFKPHITLARFKIKDKQLSPVVIPEGFELPSVQVSVQTIAIIKSDLKPIGPVYTVIDKIQLPG